jgi:hypothetical protein
MACTRGSSSSVGSSSETTSRFGWSCARRPVPASRVTDGTGSGSGRILPMLGSKVPEASDRLSPLRELPGSPRIASHRPKAAPCHDSTRRLPHERCLSPSRPPPA